VNAVIMTGDPSPGNSGRILPPVDAFLGLMVPFAVEHEIFGLTGKLFAHHLATVTFVSRTSHPARKIGVGTTVLVPISILKDVAIWARFEPRSQLVAVNVGLFELANRTTEFRNKIHTDGSARQVTAKFVLMVRIEYHSAVFGIIGTNHVVDLNRFRMSATRVEKITEKDDKCVVVRVGFDVSQGVVQLLSLRVNVTD
jgi:hypothetical protein